MKKKAIVMVSLFLVAVLLFTSCAGASGGTSTVFPGELYTQSAEMEGDILEIEFEAIPLAGAPPVIDVLMPSADGKVTYSNTSVTIDASNTANGYVMVKYNGTSSAGLKVIVTGPSNVAYTYNLNKEGKYEVFPLSDSNGEYKVGVYQNISGTKYSTLFTKSFKVELKDEFAPFLLPNQYVNYSADSKAVTLAKDLVKGSKTEFDKVDKIYSYVVKNFTYDKEKAATVQSGYLPDVDKIIELKKGICFDYAAVMAAMLRSQGVATKLVVGYTGTAYHAWLNVYTKDSGWVEGVIFFDGKNWKLMDPTFASSSNSSKKIMEYIGDGKNYSAKYLY